MCVENKYLVTDVTTVHNRAEIDHRSTVFNLGKGKRKAK